MAGDLATIATLVQAARRGEANAFCALCLKDHEGNPVDLAPLHVAMNAFIDECWGTDPPTYCGILAPWRHGKSLIGVIGRTCLTIGLNVETRVRVVCADDREATLRVAAIRRVIESKRFRRVFPHVKPLVGEWLKQQFTVQRESINPDPSVAAAGIFTTEAGGGHDVLMFDDICTYQNSYLTPAFRPLIYSTLTSVWLRRIDPKTRILAVGTAWHYDDAYNTLRRAASSSQWRWMIAGVSGDFKTIDIRIE